MIQLLLDEHVDRLYSRELRRRELSLIVWRIGDPGAPTRGTSDPDVLQWCDLHGFVLVTRDRSSMPRHLRELLRGGSHVPGILALSAASSVGETMEDLLLIAQAAAPEDLRDQITYLPLAL